MTGVTYFLMKTLRHVCSEMALYVLAYNLERVTKILGPVSMIDLIRKNAATA